MAADLYSLADAINNDIVILSGEESCLRAGDLVVVHDEIVDSLWEEDFTSHEDQQIVDDLRERFKLLGLDDSKVEEMVRAAQKAKKAPCAS
jgi:hypothetical protein